MKIIHCADIHLDSKMETHMPEKKAAKRREELKQTFSNLIEFAKEEHIDGVIIAGDLFDSERVLFNTAEFILSKIASASDIAFFYLQGNHDSNHNVFEGLIVPSNLRMFTDEWKTFKLGDVAISGIEQTSNNASSLYRSLSLDQNDTNIVIMHGSVSGNPDFNNVAVKLLANKSIDYLALGHHHSFSGSKKIDDRGIWCYSGCLEGRGFDESGEKGFILIDTNEITKPQFVPFSQRIIKSIEVDVSSAEKPSEILNLVSEKTKGINEKDIVEVILVGRLSPELSRDTVYMENELNSRFFFARVKDHTSINLEPEDYMHDISLKGEFTRLVMGSNEDQEDKSLILQAGLQALRGEEINL